MLKRKIAIVFLVLILAFSHVLIFPAIADSATISAPASAYLGDEITVTVTFESEKGSIRGVNGKLEFDSSVLQCTSAAAYTSADTNKSGRYYISYQDDLNTSSKLTLTFKFRGVTAGTGGIFVGATISDGTSSTEKQHNISIKIVDKATLSGNARASKIILSAGKIAPAFNPNITNYNVNIEHSVTEVLLSVTTQEPKAKIVIEGDKEMKVGNNKRTVIVTAPNGITKKYVLNIYRCAKGEEVKEPTAPDNLPEENPLQIDIGNGAKYMVQDYKDVDIPNNFSVALHTFGDVEVKVLKDIINGRIVVYAVDAENKNGDYYIYNEAESMFSQFRYIKTSGIKLIVLDYKEKVPELSDYSYTVVNVGDYTVNGFKYKNPELADFIIFYAENIDGVKSFYTYDAKDKTVQRAAEFTKEFNSSLAVKNQKEQTLLMRFMALDLKNKIVVISGLVVIVLILVLLVIFVIKIFRRTEKTEIDDEQTFLESLGEFPTPSQKFGD